MKRPGNSNPRVVVAVTLVACLAAVLPVAAQNGGGGSMSPEQRIERQLDQLERELELTAEQRDQVEPVLLDAAKQMNAMRAQRDQGGGGDRSAMRETMMKLQRE